MRLLLTALLLAASGAEDVGEPSTDSLYNLTAKWTDQSGKRVELKQLRGQPVVLGMIYASCQGACPLLVNDMQRIERALPEAARGKVRFVLVSFDPARDTPAKLAAYATAHGLKTPPWTLLSGSDDDVRDLAAVLGMRYRPTGTGDFVHSNLISVLDDKGVIVHRQVGLGQEPAATVEALVKGLPAKR